MLLEDFYQEVLQKLGVLAAEESPTASDRAEVVQKHIQVHAELSRRDLLNFFDDEEVPDWVADALADVEADRLAMVFSLPLDKRVELRARADAGLTTIIGDGQRRETDNENPYYY